ncbi:hypothetical protein [Gallintestinimicrobium sp.]|uniref:hypothetical protein n=1 Tax=Gallintestinimicrobium sp. TaxID=2981655 RepID=UPI003992D00B
MKKLLAMVLTVSMTAAMVGCGQAAEEAAGDVLSYADYVAADLTAVTIQYVQAISPGGKTRLLFIHRTRTAYFLYNMACSEEDYESSFGVKSVTIYKSEWCGRLS